MRMHLLEAVIALEHRSCQGRIPNQEHRLPREGDAGHPVLVTALFLGEKLQGIAQERQRHVACTATLMSDRAV